MNQNFGQVPRAGTVLRALRVFWDATLEKPPPCDSLNTLHRVTYVSNVNKAQTRNVYVKICFTACSTAGSACTLAGNVIKPTSS